MLTEDQKAELCKEVATCPAYLENLESYEKQALQQYVKAKQAELARYPEDAQSYYRLAAPAYAFADVVAALFDSPVTPVTAPEPAPLASHYKPTVREVALWLVYSGQVVTRQTAKKIAVSEGHQSGNSLYGEFLKYSQPSDRTGVANETPKRRKNMAAAILNVLPRLTGQQKEKAERELLIIKGQD